MAYNIRTTTTIVHGLAARTKLYEALHSRGLLPDNCTRFVIESDIAEPIRITADYLASEKIEQAADEIAAALAQGHVVKEEDEPQPVTN